MRRRRGMIGAPAPAFPGPQYRQLLGAVSGQHSTCTAGVKKPLSGQQNRSPATVLPVCFRFACTISECDDESKNAAGPQ